AQPARVLRPRAEMALPTPTLVGWPEDEAAYAALRRGYAIPVVAAVAGQAVGWTGEGGGRLHQAFVDLLLAELGLRDWPLAPAAYAALFDGPLDSLERVVSEWALPPAALDAGDGWRDAYAVVAFIVAAHPAERLATLHRRLAVAPDATAWLRRHNVAARDAAAQKAWLRFVAAEMETAVAPAPPAQAVQVMCNPSLGERATLYRYDVAADSWQSEVSGYYWVFMNPLPDDSGVLLQAWQPRSQGSVGMVWQGGELRDVFRQAINVHLFRVDAVQAHAAGDRLQLFEYDFGQNQAQVSVLDLGTCDEAGCAQVGLQAQPVWSPGGEQTLQMLPMGSLWLGDGRGQMTALVNQGRAPFWLDEETYGFARRQRVMRARLDGGATETLLDLGEWGTAVGLDEFAVVSIVRSAYNADWLYILLELADGAPLVVIHDMARQTTRSFRLAGALGPYNPLFTSPDGRWITVRTFETDGPGWQLHLVDAATGETRALRSGHPTSFPGFDWSADGEWLVMVRDGFLLLLAPADDYRQLIVHDFPECDFAGWVN
ncbi:MAG: hypothetical protein KC425_20695, partial [Anaerolineales bacterium]|nr:hypothetical protein [Anaerolineales bacterium]